MPPAPPEPTSRAPRRWLLRPGVAVLRRDGATLQVGLDPPQRTLLPDSAATRGLLGDLRHGLCAPEPAPDSEAWAVWSRLASADLVVPDEPAPPGVDSATLRATRAWAGPEAVRRLRDRRRLRIGLRGPSDLTGGLHRLLTTGGLNVLDTAEVDLMVWCTHGELTRDRSDALVGSGQPHLVLGSCGGLPRVGPLVVPGLTACLRCIDAHQGEADPRRPLLLEQAAARGAGPGAEQREPCDPVLGALAGALLARDVQRYAEGELPLTWSATVLVAPNGPPQVTTWARHVHCGCAWDVAAVG